uniref:GIY-YIG nuclease family protein n=1 Tax=Paractinoplanes polyasparticus TaxID=2856853 RepID=UPI001C842BD1|nr:GIY-YIG nuclease family protein [Actinoplanes polyasparticus]
MNGIYSVDHPLPPHVWLRGYTGKWLHLVDHSYPGHYTGNEMRGAAALCGAWITNCEVSIDPPKDMEGCDDCILADILEPTVYRFFDAQGRLLYVGCSENVLKRFRRHSRPYSKSAAWWPLQVRHSLTTYPNLVVALAAELHAIATESPLYNRQAVARVRRVALAGAAA